MNAVPRRPTEFSDVLYERIRGVIAPGDVIRTLASHKVNTIADVSRSGITVETEHSRRAGSTQVVPAWMVEVAWKRLVERGILTNSELLDTNDLNVKRSSFVCALLALFDDVEVAGTRPITLRMRDRAT